MAGRRWDESETHFVTALEQAKSIPHRLEQTQTERWHGQMLLERDRPGDRAEAEKVLTAAIDDYERMGMPRHRDLAEALFDPRQGGRHPRRCGRRPLTAGASAGFVEQVPGGADDCGGVDPEGTVEVVDVARAAELAHS